MRLSERRAFARKLDRIAEVVEKVDPNLAYRIDRCSDALEMPMFEESEKVYRRSSRSRRLERRPRRGSRRQESREDSLVRRLNRVAEEAKEIDPSLSRRIERCADILRSQDEGGEFPEEAETSEAAPFSRVRDIAEKSMEESEEVVEE